MRSTRSVSLRFILLAAILASIMPGCALQEAAPERTSSPTSADALPLAVTRAVPPVEAEADLPELSAGNKAFAFDLYQALREVEGNLFFSPHSLSTALAMTYSGARGETERQMADTLHFTLPQERLHPAFNALDYSLAAGGEAGDETFQLNTANSLWGQDGFPFRQAFMDELALNYGAGMRLVLANAIYFKAKWIDPFLDVTAEAPFTRLDGSQVSVPMMSRRNEAPNTEGGDYQAIELPYKGDRFSMVVLLPAEGQFEDFEQSLSRERVDEILQALQMNDVKLYLPRFSFSSKLLLEKTLGAFPAAKQSPRIRWRLLRRE